MKKKIILIIVIMAVALVIYRRFTPSPKRETTKVATGNIVSVVEASGRITAKKSVDLTFPAAGKVIWVGVKKGDVVYPYQWLAQMDSREIEKNLRSKLLSYLTVRSNFDQTKEDHKIIITDIEKRLLERSQYGLDQSVLDVEIAALAKEQAVMVSPIAGVVVDDANLLPGEWLGATAIAQRTMRITDPTSLYFLANIDEVDFNKVTLHQAVEIRLDSFPTEVFVGRVAFIGQTGVKKTGGSVQIPVEITFDSPPANLLAELNGDVKIILGKKDSVLLLDKRYVVKKGDTYTVKLLEKNKVVDKPILIGLSSPEAYEIVSGITLGQEIVAVSN